MKLRFTRPAARQLDRVLAYIVRHSPQGAYNLQRRIETVAHMLTLHPNMGQITARPGIRRIVASPYPYALTYRPTIARDRYSRRAPYVSATARRLTVLRDARVSAFPS